VSQCFNEHITAVKRRHTQKTHKKYQGLAVSCLNTVVGVLVTSEYSILTNDEEGVVW